MNKQDLENIRRQLHALNQLSVNMGKIIDMTLFDCIYDDNIPEEYKYMIEKRLGEFTKFYDCFMESVNIDKIRVAEFNKFMEDNKLTLETKGNVNED